LPLAKKCNHDATDDPTTYVNYDIDTLVIDYRYFTGSLDDYSSGARFSGLENVRRLLLLNVGAPYDCSPPLEQLALHLKGFIFLQRLLIAANYVEHPDNIEFIALMAETSTVRFSLSKFFSHGLFSRSPGVKDEQFQLLRKYLSRKVIPVVKLGFCRRGG
jgi:hypothetical protein